MTRIGLSLVLTALLVSPVAAQPAAQPPAQPSQSAKPPATQPAKPAPGQPPAGNQALKTIKDQASYAIGVDIARNLQEQELDVNPAMVARGLVDALTSDKLALTEEQLQNAITEFSKIVKQQAEQRAAKSTQDAETFLAENAKKEGVTVLPSGLQYKVLKKGADGPSPKLTDTVRVHYHGTFVNGKVFDSSVERKEPINLEVSGVIKGWTEALQLMHVGDKWQLVIPAKLAYGDQGGGRIPPGSTLIFEVELLEIVK
jgi:FKBP-type peptidyl-prolyl cis-trans isomerase FklB